MVEHEGDEGPYGAKSVGEIATVPTAAAVINALNHALGTAITTLPATPERVLAALAELAAAGGQQAPPARGEPSCS
jgi:CO/xanthine dehydrogenase Mo-binding subunit